MKAEWLSEEERDNSAIAAEIIHRPDLRKVICFYGEMGAGKTTFIKSFCQQTGVEDTIQSPTFSIVNEYQSGSGEPVYHFDFYRLKSEEEAYDLGYEQYLFSGYFCLIEWPEKIAGLLQGVEVTNITITVTEEGRRIRMQNG